MAAGRRDFEGALGAFLALDVLEIDAVTFDLTDFRLRTGEHLRAAKVVGQLDQRSRRYDIHVRASRPIQSD